VTDKPTVPEVRRSWELEAIVALVPEALRPAIRWVRIEDVHETVNPEGTLEVLPGQNPLRPVIRYCADVEGTAGQLVAGSGRYPKANDTSILARTTGYKRSKSYREAIEAAIPFEDPDARYSLERLIDDAFEAAEGSPQTVQQCPHLGCTEKHVVAFKKDGNLIFKLIELIVGKAPQTLEITGELDVRLAEVMGEREAPVNVLRLTREEAEDRKRQLVAQGIVDKEWVAVEVVPREEPEEEA
jgi:hypothetical protein